MNTTRSSRTQARGWGGWTGLGSAIDCQYVHNGHLSVPGDLEAKMTVRRHCISGISSWTAGRTFKLNPSALLEGQPRAQIGRLLHLQNWVAHPVMQLPRHSHIRLVLADQHWLPVH